MRTNHTITKGYFAVCLKVARLAAELTQQQLGERCNPPVAQHNVARDESGQHALSERTLERYARALGCSLPDLVSRGKLRSRLVKLDSLGLDHAPTAHGVRYRLERERESTLAAARRWL